MRGLLQGAIRLVIENVLQEEVRELVGARRFERLGQRKDVRYGTYLRRLLTSLGQIGVTVPRARPAAAPRGARALASSSRTTSSSRGGPVP